MNNTCEAFDTALLDLVYGELPEDQAEALRAHAAACPRCREALEQFRLVRKMAGQIPPLEPPGDLDERVLHAAATAIESGPLPAGVVIPGPGLWNRVRAAMLTPALATAAVAGLVLVLSFFLAKRPTDRQEAPDREMRVMDQEAPPDIKSAAAIAEPGAEKDTITLAPAPPTTEPSAKPAPARRRVKPAAAPKSAEQKKVTRAPARAMATAKKKSLSETRSAGASADAEIDGLPGAPFRSSSRAKAESAPQAASLSAAGRAAYPRGDCRTAQVAYEEIIRQPAAGPTQRATALHALARCESRQGRSVQAIARYKTLLLGYPNYPDRPEALWEAAACHRRIGQADGGRTLLLELQRVPGWRDRAGEALDRLSE